MLEFQTPCQTSGGLVARASIWDNADLYRWDNQRSVVKNRLNRLVLLHEECVWRSPEFRFIVLSSQTWRFLDQVS